MKFVRWFLGRLILAVNFLTSPKAITRTAAEQDTVDARCAKLALYQFSACPFCVKVRRQMKRLALNIELRDAKNNAAFEEELVREGGSRKVPCLRIDNGADGVTWMYESNDIIAFLKAEFAPA